MRKWLVVCLAAIAALVPGGAIGYAEGGGGHASNGDIDIVHVEMQGSLSTNADVRVFGTLNCGTGAGPINLDVTLLQESTGGTGAGANKGHTCRPGKTIKWVQTAQGLEMMVDDPITVTVTAALVDLAPFATATEELVLDWGLHTATD